MTKFDKAMVTIADYVHSPRQFSDEAYHTACACLADSLGCAILALRFPECTKLLGPVVPGTIVPHGSRVPGTSYILDPVTAAFNIGAMIRWLDYNDTWLAAEWGHPSDNIGGLLATADYLSQTSQPDLTVKDLFHYMIQAYEIQGILALKNSFNRIGFDHVILVKAATTAVTSKMLGANYEQTLNAISNSWIDTGPLRTYRHAPNTGSRKSWAAGDATSRGLQMAMLAMKGEMGYPSALKAKKWGLYDVLFQGKPFDIPQELGCYVMENVLFKISFPAEFHAQTAVEAALKLHEKVKNRLDKIEKIEILTHEPTIRIIDKTGPLKNPADRDHCIQYMVAAALIFGTLTEDHYEDAIAADSRIDTLRNKMVVKENKQFTEDYLDPNKLSIANTLKLYMKGGAEVAPITVEYPVGHRRRRQEGLPLLFEKLRRNLRSNYPKARVDLLNNLFQDYDRLCAMPISHLVNLFVAN